MRLLFHSSPADPQYPAGPTLLQTLPDKDLRELHGAITQYDQEHPAEEDPRFERVAFVSRDVSGGIRFTVQRLMSAQSVNG